MVTGPRPALRADALLAAIVDSSDDAILSKDLEGTITSWNVSAQRMYGYSAQEMIGRNVSVLLPPDRPAEIAEILRRISSGERILHFETTRVRKNGGLIDVSLSVSPVRDEQGTIVGASTIARDITELKAIDQERQQYTAALERSNRDLESFAYVVSHDLAEPLRMISSFSQLLSEAYDEKPGSDGATYIGYIVEGAARMRALIDDLLTYSRIGTDVLNFAEVDLHDLVNETWLMLRDIVGEASATIDVADLPCVVADPIKMRQVIQNLLTNAVKFRRPDRQPHVRIFGSDGGEEWTVTVEDNGIGIDMRHAARIFDLFQRLHTRSEYPGTGIGLSICQRIVERHGGRIWVESREDAGSRFVLTLPKSPL